jgi:hypothetical protein
MKASMWTATTDSPGAYVPLWADSTDEGKGSHSNRGTPFNQSSIVTVID